MEEDVGVKVTRLRRRLSVEQADDISSPSTPSKKRGGRLAAKPQLELIDENAQGSSPKKPKRKSVVKADTEEKPVTPSRRSTRIKSNTSIVLETLSAQITDSPRAKRALRRTSQAGSDNEGPATPARQTRRTRKDSASNIENQEPAALNRPSTVVETVIDEEPENETQKEANKSKAAPSITVEELSPNSARKSKRLLEKRRSGSHKSDHDCSAGSEEIESINISAKTDILKAETEVESKNQLNKSSEFNEFNDKLSESNRNLLKTLDMDSKINTSNHNRSSNDLMPKKTEHKKRNRLESWPTAATSANDVFFSDNEQSKKKNKKMANITPLINYSRSSIINTTTKEDSTISRQNEKENSQIFLDSSLKRKKSQSETSYIKEAEISESIQPTQIQATKKTTSSNTGNTVLKPENDNVACDIEMLFQKSPCKVQAIVYFGDSDSNSGNTETVNKIQPLNSEDQCVPVVEHDIELKKELTVKPSQPIGFKKELSPKPSQPISNSQESVIKSQPVIEKETCNVFSISKKANEDVDNSCEPMDIDETINEKSFKTSQNPLQDSIAEGKTLSLSQSTGIIEKPNISKRKSSISTLNSPDRSKNENKSTLILSQIKDVSATSEKSLKSPNTVTTEILSKSINTVHNNSNMVSKTNISLCDLKGTPLKQKNVEKLSMQTSTPITTQLTDNKTNLEETNDGNENNNSSFSKSINESSEENSDSDEPSGPKSKYLDDKAEVASDDYESGDSRDEEERQYEDEHIIPQQGETLESDEYASNDTDYEKDSFVVSSDAEDDDLLSGSGDDLSMSDKELTMSKKSKRKYNEHKSKERKNASREMYQSRHKLNTSEQKLPASKAKNSRIKIDSSLLESDEEVVVKTKKNNRLRLDSTLDTSTFVQDNANESLNKSNNNSDKSSRATIFNQSAINENEITVCNKSIGNTDPLLVHFKQEPKTPEKDLNISVVQFTDRQEIENVEVAESNSIVNQTKTDPLQATMACVDTSDSSENEEIIQNYDSVLNELNKNKKIKEYSNNISLNISKIKSKKNKNEPIIDQLNLTNTKKQNKSQLVQSKDIVDFKTFELPKQKFNSDDEGSSNSIDLQLLFSEDNCGSGDENTSERNEHQNIEEIFVPLRKSMGKTNILEKMDKDISQHNTTLNESSKKKNKRKSSIVLTESVAEPKDELDCVLNESIKKKIRKSSLDAESLEQSQDTFKSRDESFQKSTKKKKRKSSMGPSGTDEEPKDTSQAEDVTVVNKSSPKLTKQRVSLLTELLEESQDIPNKEELVLNDSITKKKKRKSSIATEEVGGDLFFIDTTGVLSPDKDDNGVLEKTPPQVSEKKKKTKKLDCLKKNIETNVLRDDESDDAPMEVLYRSEKASNREAALKNSEDNTESADTSGKKIKKKKIKTSTAVGQNQLEDITETADTSSGKSKKNKKRKTSTTISDQSGEFTNITEDNSLNKSKKRKRKSSDTGGAHDSVADGVQGSLEIGTLNESLSTGSHKKKRKISSNDQNNAEANIADHGKRPKKKKKNNEQPPEPETIQTEIKKNKKRKERDEDNDSKKTKVSKENSFQEVHLPKLPPSILSQLDDKPKKVFAKPKVISTSKFVVENARQKRAKPSNYLEESVYLDADSIFDRKEKSRIKKPKVLPFLPTASTSEKGFTTNFKINTVSQNIHFVAEPMGISFSKERYLQKREIKKMGTYDLYKKQVNKKLSKF